MHRRFPASATASPKPMTSTISSRLTRDLHLAGETVAADVGDFRADRAASTGLAFSNACLHRRRPSPTRCRLRTVTGRAGNRRIEHDRSSALRECGGDLAAASRRDRAHVDIDAARPSGRDDAVRAERARSASPSGTTVRNDNIGSFARPHGGVSAQPHAAARSEPLPCPLGAGSSRSTCEPAAIKRGTIKAP